MAKAKLSVMVVDDSEVDSYLVQEIINESNYFSEISAYSSSSIALDFVLGVSDMSDLPDLILLDINMPIMDGFEFIDSIADVYDDGFSPVVFILTSSLQMRDYENFDKQYTAAEFLKKPLELSVFKEMVKKHFPKIK